MNFYYFVASLPPVSLTGAPALDMEVFLADARRLLDAGTVAKIESLLEGGFEGIPGASAERLRDAEVLLRNAIVRTRAAKADVDAAAFQKPARGFSQQVEQVVTEAFAKPNPLERELTLDRFRLALLDDWTRATPFGESAVLAYAMKLKMAHRWARLNDEAGRARLNATVTQVRAALAGADSANG